MPKPTTLLLRPAFGSLKYPHHLILKLTLWLTFWGHSSDVTTPPTSAQASSYDTGKLPIPALRFENRRGNCKRARVWQLSWLKRQPKIEPCILYNVRVHFKSQNVYQGPLAYKMFNIISLVYTVGYLDFPDRNRFFFCAQNSCLFYLYNRCSGILEIHTTPRLQMWYMTGRPSNDSCTAHFGCGKILGNEE